MFRKIVSRLSFSPALIGQLGFYAKRLKQEQNVRRTGLIFVALALVVQSLVVFQPIESANAASDNDMVYGGLGVGSERSFNKFLTPYDANTRHLKDIFNQVGITRQEITAAKFQQFTVGDKLSWGLKPRFSKAQGEEKVSVMRDGKKVTNVYARPLKLFNGSSAKIWGWVGYSENLKKTTGSGWFAIMQSCGNLVTNGVPEDPEPEPANIGKTKTGINVTQGNVAADSVTAKAGDRLTFTITAKNTGGTAATVKLEDDLEDTLEYASLVDNGGGTFNSTTKVLSWPDITLKPGEQQSRTFSVQLLASIPATPQGVSDPSSYDCKIVNTFGTSIIVPVDCTPPKVVETVVKELPQTGPAENFIFSGVVLAIVLYFYLRSRQLNKEVRLIRRSINTGAL